MFKIPEIFLLLDEVRRNGAAWVECPDLKPVWLRTFYKAEQDFPSGVFNSHPDEVDYETLQADQHSIMMLRMRLEELFLKSVPGTFVQNHFLGFGANTDIKPWHNDYGSAFAGHNVTINCFFDDTSEETGGAFEIKHAERDEVRQIYPKKNTIIIFNQNKEWLHRVTPSNRLRRVISFAAFIPSLV